MKPRSYPQWVKKLYQKIKLGYDPVKPKVSPTVCVVPWMHLNFEPSGRVMPCCLTSTHNYESGNLNEQTIEEIWNSPNQRALRKEMIEGKRPEICRKCFDREDVTSESGRVFHNKEFPEVLEKIPEITLDDGTCTTMELKYWDFRFSNLCNYKCRSCGTLYSSAWVPDAKKMGWTVELEKVAKIDSVEGKNNYDFIEEQVKHVKKIYFAGGEPLLMPEHWQTLDILVKNKRFDVKLSYNTNCSTLEYQGRNVLDYWRQWDKFKVEVWPSIDEIGPRAELIRSGTVWPKVERNLKELLTLDNITVRPGLTIGAMNVFRVPEIVQYLIDLGVVSEKNYYKNFFINLLEEPKHYNVEILPMEFRKEIIDKIENFISETKSKYQVDNRHLFKQLLHELTKPYNPDSARKFVMMTQRLDKIRNEDTFNTIPELKCVLDAVS